jgi:hypothetical protein
MGIKQQDREPNCGQHGPASPSRQGYWPRPKRRAHKALLTGPLAGAPVSANSSSTDRGASKSRPPSFTLLDEYQRQIFVGARINYNLTDWLALGVWGGFSPGPSRSPRPLPKTFRPSITCGSGEHGADRATRRRLISRPSTISVRTSRSSWDHRLDRRAASHPGPVPRQNRHLPEHLRRHGPHFFVGPAFAGVKERGDCGPKTSGGACTNPSSFTLKGARPLPRRSASA